MTAALYLAQQLLNALQVSVGYGLMASAYVLVHAVTRRINLAFGALSIWAGYVLIQAAFLAMLLLPGRTVMPVLLAAAVAVASTALLGGVIERTVIRPIVASPTLAVLIATLALAIVLEEVLRLSSGSRERWLAPMLSEPVVLLAAGDFPLQMTRMQVLVLVTAAGLTLALDRLIARHTFGRLWRACAEDRQMAELCGIDIARVLQGTFVLASAYAGAAGVLITAHYGSASFHGGLVVGMKALLVAVIGGLGSVRGALLGGLLLGTFETLWSGYVSGEYRDVAAFLALTAVLIMRPEGLSGEAGRPDHRD